MKMKIISILWKAIKTILFTIVNLLLLYILGAIIFSLLGTHPPAKQCFPENEIYISTNGVHLDIIFPTNEINYTLRNQLEINPNTKFVSFGWGDKQFYIQTPEWKDLTVPVAFKALFLKSETAMHVTRYSQSYPHWNKITLCPEQLKKLNEYIVQSFARNSAGNVEKVPVPGYGYNDTFYDANGSFSLFRTCNIWVNNALKKAGIRTAIWSPFDVGVLYHIKKIRE